MTSDGWRRIEDLYHAALERAPSQRSSYLEQACGMDRELRRHVVALLRHEEESEEFLNEAAVAVAAQSLALDASDPTPGRTFGRYRIVSVLGAGGMGTVYAAEDSRLGRTVALKFLHDELTDDPEALEQFRREARALSAMNHPNICDIYDIDEVEGKTFLAMECVSGKRLDELIRGAGLPVERVLSYATEIADALASAHAAGIVHRDLKPGNVMITGGGHAKLLDFGVAKLAGTRTGERAGGTDGGIPQSHTLPGTIIGTVAYLSPEQAQGKKVDARSDIFAFGAVLYEMITGQRAFRGETNLSTLAAILSGDPVPLKQVCGAVPPGLERIVARCLEKDPARRFQKATDLNAALNEVREKLNTGRLAAPRRKRGYLVAAIAGVSLCAVAWMVWRSPATSAPPYRLTLSRLTPDSGLALDPSISPDGTLLAYASDRGGSGKLGIWVQQVVGGTPVCVTNGPADDIQPNFSPDGARIAFRSQRDGGGVYVVPALGGQERLVAKGGRAPRFSPDGKWIAFEMGGGGKHMNNIYIVRSTGGAPVQLKTQVPWATAPLWSPDGKRIIFQGSLEAYASAQNSEFDWWVAPMEGGQAIATGAFALFNAHKLNAWMRTTMWVRGTELTPAVWRGDSIIFTAQSGDSFNLWRVAIDPGTFHIGGAPERLTTGADYESKPSQSVDGRIVFAATERRLELREVALDANQGKLTGAPRQFSHSTGDSTRPSFSADGGKLAFLSSRTGNADVWVRDMETGKETALTATPWEESHPAISPDGSRVFYASMETGKGVVYIHTLATGAVEKICEGCERPAGWSYDGRTIFYQSGQPIGWKSIDTVTRQTREVMRHPRYPLQMLRQSPDGNWIAFHIPIEAEESRSPIMIARLRNGAAGSESEWIEVTDGKQFETTPWWSPNGAILYFFSKRDGFQCIWARRLDPGTKRPAGPVFDIAHFHDARLQVNEPGVGPAASGSLTVLTMRSRRGNIWSAVTERQK